jgi:hypothetical protein
MTTEKSAKSWIRDIVVLPLMVGLVVAIITYLLPELLAKGKQLSYTVEEPFFSGIKEVSFFGNELAVDELKIPSLLFYKVHIWNSGGVSFTNLPIRLVFYTDNPDFEVVTINHETTPRFEFGTISEERIENTSLKFTYELINPGNEDTITFVTNDYFTLGVYAKAEGINIKSVEQYDWSKWFVPGLVLISVFASLITLLITMFQERIFLGIKSRFMKPSGKIKPE